jgi:hypothetical protein
MVKLTNVPVIPLLIGSHQTAMLAISRASQTFGYGPCPLVTRETVDVAVTVMITPARSFVHVRACTLSASTT